MQKSDEVLQKEIEAAHATSIPEWKDVNKRVKSIVVSSKLLKEKFAFIIAKPTPTVMDAIAKYEHDGKVHKIEEVLIGNCVKAGPVETFTQDLDIKNAVLGKVMDLFERLEVTEKEL
jgi:hypothetical protein